MKTLLAAAPVCLVAMAYALTQGDWESVGLFALIEVLIFMNFRADKRSDHQRVPGSVVGASEVRPIGRIRRSPRQALATSTAMLLLVTLAAPVSANAADASPLVAFLLKPGDMSGFTPGKPRVFRTVAAVETASGEKPTELEIKRYEAEGFVEAATVRIHSNAEPAARGISSVFEFESPIGARAEMKAELKEEIDSAALRKKVISDYFVVRHFKVPGVPRAVAFAFVSNRKAERLGVESGVAKGLFVEGNCLFAVGVARFKSNEVVEPVVGGVQAIFNRSGGICP